MADTQSTWFTRTGSSNREAKDLDQTRKPEIWDKWNVVDLVDSNMSRRMKAALSFEAGNTSWDPKPEKLQEVQ